MTTTDQNVLLDATPVRDVRPGAGGSARRLLRDARGPGPGAGEEGDDDRRLHEVAQHLRPGDVERREVAGLHAAGHQRPDGGGQAGAAPAEPRDERRGDRRGRHRRDVLARLEVDRLPGRSGSGAARARRPRRLGRRLGGARLRDDAAGDTAAATPQTPAQPGAAGAQTGQGGRGGAASTPPPRRVELRNLSTGEVRSWQDIGTFAFSATSTHLFLRRRGGEAPAAAGGRGGGGTPPATPPAPGGAQASGAGQHDDRRARRRHHPAGPPHGPAPAARRRRRHRVQPDRRAARLHRGRGREGRQRPVRVRHAERAHHAARQRRQELQPARPGARTATPSPC